MKALEKILDKEMADTWRDSVKKDFDAALRPKLISGRVYPAFFPMDPGDVVLNLGCGLGPQAVTYAGRYNWMIGVDIDMDKLVFAKRAADYYQLAFYPCRCDVEHLPFPGQTFDTVIAVDVIEHVLRPDILVSEAFRVLKSEGQMLITFPCLIDDWKKLLLWGRAVGQSCQTNGIIGTISRTLFRPVAKRARRFFDKQVPTREASEAGAGRGFFNPDTHKHHKDPTTWVKVIESSGFKVMKSRSTTLFPPLHAMGVAKFWFTNDLIFRIDSLFSRQRMIKNCGQSMVCLAKKNTGHTRG